jgi:hypothetical protein
VTIDVTLRFVLSTKIIRRTTWRRFGDDAAGDDGGDLVRTARPEYKSVGEMMRENPIVKKGRQFVP